MNQEKIGKVIKEIRESNNLTQKQFADKLGVTFQAVSKWENGKSLPDISIIQLIGKNFNIDINDLLKGKKKNNNFKIFKILSLIILLVLVILISVFLLTNNKLNLKFVSSECNNFIINGVVVFTKDNTSIHITNIEYCDNDKEIYESFESTLYELEKNKEIIINKNTSDESNTLDKYLKTLKFSIDNYKASCKKYEDTKFYIKIEAKNYENKTITYKIPITLQEYCILDNSTES